jgi:SAM-dependent methyltransferase
METNQDLSAQYQHRFDTNVAYREAVWATLTRSFFQQFIPPHGTVLDLGAGWGEFIRHIHAGRKMAMDMNPEMPKRVGPDVVPLIQDCSEPWALDAGSLDVIFTSNFFEHLPDKQAVRRTLLEANRCLKQGGKIICLGPNIRYVPGSYWDFWDHHVALTERSLSEALVLAGFGIDRFEARFLPYSMSQGFAPPVWLLEAYLRMPLLWPIMGKQFLVIAKKK